MFKMKDEEIDEIRVSYDENIPKEELLIYISQEKEHYQKKHKDIASMKVRVDGDEVEIESYERSPIIRTRRITGYLSTVDRFNDAKRAELKARVAHA